MSESEKEAVGDEVKAYRADVFKTSVHNLGIDRVRLARFSSPETQEQVGVLTAELVGTVVQLSAQLEAVNLTREQRANILMLWGKISVETLRATQAIHNPIRNEPFSADHGYQAVNAQGDYEKDKLALSELSLGFKSMGQ